jgi:sec-independent protein translocase protein TatB
MGRMRRSFVAVKNEIEREIGMDEVRRQLHNESILNDIKRLEREVRVDKSAPSAPGATMPTAAPRAATDPAAAPSVANDAPRSNGTAG